VKLPSDMINQTLVSGQTTALREQLTRIAGNLGHMLEADGALSGSKIAPELKTFVSELEKVLRDTRGIPDQAAFTKLEAAKAGLASLMGDLSARQESIMKEEESQKDSLLLGVLMTHQKSSKDEQLSILSSDDFKDLPVSKALLAHHNTSAPLFGQAAAYLDTHASKGVRVQAKDAEAAKTQIDATAQSLQKFVDSLQKSYDARTKQHTKRMHELDDAKSKAKTKKDKLVLKSIEKREERNYKKWAGVQKHDIDAMKSAVAAVRRGDLKALDRAQDALKQSMDQMRSHNSGFLVLLSMGSELMSNDCPYCVAQCVDKCHQDGQPYTTCLTTCADAGEGK
jgi:hypothetical protein